MPLARPLTALALAIAVAAAARAQSPPQSAVERAQQGGPYAGAAPQTTRPTADRAAPAPQRGGAPPDGDVRQATYAAPLPTREKTRISRNGDAADGQADAEVEVDGPHMPWLATFASLAGVLALFFAVVWVMRRGTPAAAQPLPADVFAVLGRAALAPRLHAQLLRCGNKLLLVAITPAGAETLTEITDPLEIDRLAGLCNQANPHGATAAFRQIFQQFAGEKVSGFVGDPRSRGRKAPLDEEAD